MGQSFLFQEMNNNLATLNVQAAIHFLALANQSQSEGSQHRRSASTIAVPEQTPACQQVKLPDPYCSTDASAWLLEPATDRQSHANRNTVAADSRSFDAPYGIRETAEASSSTSVAMLTTPDVNVDTFDKWWEGQAWVKREWYILNEDEDTWGCLLCGKVALTQHIQSRDHLRLEATAIAGGGWKRKELPSSFIPHPDPKFKR